MFLYSIAFLCALISVVLLYYSNKNQRLRPIQGRASARYAGVVLSFVSLAFWLQVMSVAAGIFTWFLLLSIFAVGVPVLTLIKAGKET